MEITVENLVKVFYDKEKVACPITEKLIKAGYQQLSDGYIANAKKCGIEVDYSKALPTQWWHLIESYCNFSGKCPYEGKRNFAQVRCGELIVWMAEVLDCVDKKELEKLVDDIISKPIDYKGTRPIYKNCNDRIKALCYDKIEKKIELLCKD